MTISENGADISDPAAFRLNLHLDRIVQDDTETRFYSPDKQSYIFTSTSGWGAYRSKPAGYVPLLPEAGGTGAKDAAGARTNLGIGGAGVLDVGKAANTVAAGDDSRIVGAMQKNQNGKDISDISAFRQNIGLKTAALCDTGVGAGQIPDMSAFQSGNGWVKYPDGTIIQRGVSISGSMRNPAPIPLPIPFTQSGFVITTAFDSASGAVNDCPTFAATPIGLTGFHLMSSRTDTGNGAGANWIAIGK